MDQGSGYQWPLTSQKTLPDTMCHLMEIHTTNDTFLPKKKSNPESDQASRSICQFIGTTWIKECETILLLGHDEQNPECGKLEKTNDPLSPTSSKALKMMGEKPAD